jgi:hygromycin-B 4-O-kinase
MGKISPSENQVTEFLQSQFNTPINKLSPVSYGDWATTYSFETNQTPYILRIGEIDEDFKKDQFAHRFATPTLPIPKIIKIGQAFGGYYAISEKLAGKILDLLPKESLQALTPGILKLLDELRQTDTSSTSGFGNWTAPTGNGQFDSWRESLLDISRDDSTLRGHGWKQNLRQHGGTHEFDHLYLKMQQLLDRCPEERHLLHADLLHFNLLVKNNNISGVLDWGCSKYGDFLYELAWFIFWSPWFPAMKDIDYQQAAFKHYQEIGLEVPNFQNRLLCYQLHIALDSIAYCSYTKNWKQAQQVTKQAVNLLKP